MYSSNTYCAAICIQAAAEELADLIETMKLIESICNGQFAFWQYQADKFRSFGANVQKYNEPNMLELIRSDLLRWLDDRKVTMDRYYALMQDVVSDDNFVTSLPHTKFPPVYLPNLQLTL